MELLEQVSKQVGDLANRVGPINTTLDEIKATIARQGKTIEQMQADREHAIASVRTPWDTEGGTDIRRACPWLSSRFSLTAAMQAYAHYHSHGQFPKPDKDALIRAGHFPEAVERAMSGKISTDGGFLIADAYRAEIIAALLPRTIMGALGVRMMSVGERAGQIRWPKQNSRPTVTAVPEAGAPTESTPTWQQVVASPHKAGMLMAVPNEVLKYGVPDTERFLLELLEKELRIEIDTRVLRGVGAANEPLGMLGTADIQNPAVGANGGAITYNLILDLITQVEESNTQGTKFGFACHPRGQREILQVLDSQNRPIFFSPEFAPGLVGPRPGNLMGYPVHKTTHITIAGTKGSGTALTELWFAAWDEILLTMWGDIEVRQSDQATDGTNNAWTSDLTLARAFVTYDVTVDHAQGVGVISDMNSA